MTPATLINEMSAATPCRGPLSPDDKAWYAILEQAEFGDYDDNLSVYLIVRYAMHIGYREEGLRIIKKLQKQIIKSADPQSREWLLPKLNSYLQALD